MTASLPYQGRRDKMRGPERLQNAESVIVLAGRDLDTNTAEALIEALDKKSLMLMHS